MHSSENHPVLGGAVTDIEMGAFGDVWVCAVEHPQLGGGGVAHFDGSVWTGYTADDGLPSNEVYCIAVADDGTVWAGTDGDGAATFDGVTWSPCSVEDVPHEDVFAADFDAAGRLWIGGIDGVTVYDGSSFTHLDCALGFPGYWMYDTAFGPDGRPWFATSSGVGAFDPSLL